MNPLAYLRTVALTLAVILLFHVLVFLYQLGALFPSSYWARNAQIVKDYLLASAENRKLILIAGSSGHFGFASRLFAERLQYTPVNYSLHYNFPLDYYFAKIKPHLHSGDIVLLPLEYEYYSRTTPYLSPFVSDVMNFDVQFFWNLTPSEQLKFVGSVPLHRLIGGVIAMLFDSRMRESTERGHSALLPASEVVRIWQEQPSHRGSYNGYPFQLINVYGDFGGPLVQLETRWVGYAITKPFRYSRYTWETLAAFAQWCRDHGVTLLATWPPTMKDPRLDFQSPRVLAHVRAIVSNYRAIGIEVLGTPHDFQFERDWFGDSPYHLSLEGRIARTRLAATLLAEALAPSTASPPSTP